MSPDEIAIELRDVIEDATEEMTPLEAYKATGVAISLLIEGLTAEFGAHFREGMIGYLTRRTLS